MRPIAISARSPSIFSAGDKASELLKMLLLEAVMKGGGGDPGDRLVNASSNGNFQAVREILEANPDKVNQIKSFTPFEL